MNAEESASIDARYERIPSFAEWPHEVPRQDLVDRALGELSELQERASVPQADQALRVAVRAAAFDTGAIEGLYETDRGLTRTVATQAAMWEQALTAQSMTRAFFDAQLATYELVLDATTKHLPVTEAWIRRLHEELTAPQETYTVHTPVGPQQQPLPRGEYKLYPNHVETADGSAHAYAPVAMTGPEMACLVEEITSDAFLEAHPVIQASYAHYALVRIHPFADGNGRVARALASVYFYRALAVPVLILADQRDEYFRALASADQGDARSFVAFLARAAKTAMDMVAETIRAALAPEATELLTSFRGLLMAQGGLTHQELDGLGSAVQNEFVAALQARIAELDLPPGVTAQVAAGAGNLGGSQPEGFREIVEGGGRYATVDLASAPPAGAREQLVLNILVSTREDDAEAVRIQLRDADAHLIFGLRDIHPSVSAAAQHRMRAFTDRILGMSLSELLRLAEAALVAAGFRGRR